NRVRSFQLPTVGNRNNGLDAIVRSLGDIIWAGDCGNLSALRRLESVGRCRKGTGTYRVWYSKVHGSSVEFHTGEEKMAKAKKKSGLQSIGLDALSHVAGGVAAKPP